MSSIAIDSHTVTERSPSRPAFAIVLIFAVSFLGTALLMTPDIFAFDEGIILTGAMRVATGAIPHRDFYANYGPGQFYVLAGLFDLFGQTVLVERVYDVVVKAGIVCVVYRIATRLMRPVYAALATAFCLLWIVAAQFPAYPIWPSLLLILASIWIVLPLFCGSYSVLRLFCAGTAAGGVVLFRYDMGLLTLIVLSAALVLFSLFEPSPFGSRTRRLAAMLGPFWGAASLLLMALASVYIRYGIANDFLFQIVTYPSSYYAETRRLPFPMVLRGHLSDMVIYMPCLVIAGYLVMIITQLKERNWSKSERQEAWISSLIASFTTGLYFKGVVRVSIIHMMSSIIPSFIILGYVLDRFISRSCPFDRRALAVPVGAAVIFALVPSLNEARHVRGIARWNLSHAIKIAQSMIWEGELADWGIQCDAKYDPRARCFNVSIPELETLRYVVSHSAPDQPIFVANGVNDKTLINNMALYFLSGRQPATKWSQFDPGLENTEPIQGEMVRELDAKKPPLVILDTEWDDINEPNRSGRHSGVTLLDDYIHMNYRPAANFAPYTLWQRCLTPAPCGF
jgi:hypothetical protein